jgi:hypothetical protein
MKKQVDFWINEVERLDAGVVPMKETSSVQRGIEYYHCLLKI